MKDIHLLIYKQLTPKQKAKMAERAFENLILKSLKETYTNRKQTPYTYDEYMNNIKKGK